METLGEACAHGQLARQCELCERDKRIEELDRSADIGRELMRRAWNEFNVIRARDGAPPGVSPAYWDEMTNDLQAILGDDAVPWMLAGYRRVQEQQEKQISELEVEVMELRDIIRAMPCPTVQFNLWDFSITRPVLDEDGRCEKCCCMKKRVK